MAIFQNLPESICVPLQGEPVSRYLTDDGLVTGTKDASLNHAAAAVDYFIAPAARSRMLINRLIVSYQHTGGGTVSEFANLNVALTNGITLKKKDASGDLVDFTDGVPITTNGDWARYCYDVNRVDWGNGPDVFSARWTFAKDGYWIDLSGSDGEYLAVTLNDDLSLVDWLYFRVAGIQILGREV